MVKNFQRVLLHLLNNGLFHSLCLCWSLFFPSRLVYVTLHQLPSRLPSLTNEGDMWCILEGGEKKKFLLDDLELLNMMGDRVWTRLGPEKLQTLVRMNKLQDIIFICKHESRKSEWCLNNNMKNEDPNKTIRKLRFGVTDKKNSLSLTVPYSQHRTSSAKARHTPPCEGSKRKSTINFPASRYSLYKSLK